MSSTRVVCASGIPPRMSLSLLPLLLLLLLLTCSAVARPLRAVAPFPGLLSHVASSVPEQPSPSYRVLFYNQTLDHFNFQTPNLKWSQRYILSADYWLPSKGPILFYTGNEGDIFSFWNNTGFMYYLAEKFDGLLVFAEHRYYGESLPFGANSLQLENIGYLTSEQALADYAELIGYLKATLPGAKDVPVVAFGGSYGGMLAAWFRIKYPHVVDGALGSSGPVAFFGNLTNHYAFYEVVTEDFARADPACADNIRQGFNQILATASAPGGLQNLTKSFDMCAPIVSQSQVGDLISFLQTTYTNLAMYNYPYPTNFLQPMPAWPVQVACQYLPPNVSDLFAGMLQAAQVFSGTGCTAPEAPEAPAIGQVQWEYQACTEMVFPYSSNGVTDMFLPYAFNFTQVGEQCAATYNTTTRPLWAIVEYGARDLFAASNIIFSNGALDPCRVGGVLEPPADSIVCLTIDDAAHHLDLRYPNAADPKALTAARAIEEQTIRTWIDKARARTERRKRRTA